MSQRHPSASPQIDRSALKVGFRSENAAGAAADPSGDASSFLCSPMRRGLAGFERRAILFSGVPVLVPVRASPVPSVVRGSFVVKFFFLLM